MFHIRLLFHEQEPLMQNAFLKKTVRDPYVIVSVITGAILLMFTLLFRVNPAECSVVNEAICGTFFHYILLFTTMPAWIAGVIVGLGTPLSYPLMFLFQAIIFTLLGLLLRLIHRGINRCLHFHR